MVGHVSDHQQIVTHKFAGFIYGLVYIFNEAFPLGKMTDVTRYAKSVVK